MDDPRHDDPRLLPHQREAVGALLAILAKFGGALLADDVGLGKSYIAAAVAGHFAKAGIGTEVIVPEQLVPQWSELRDLFDLPAEVVSHDAILRMATIPGAMERRLVIVDEAHRFRNPQTQRYRALALRAIGNHLLLVTATPFCNSSADLHALVSLFAADDAFRLEGIDSLERLWSEDDIVTQALAQVMVRRDRSVSSSPFPDLGRRVVRFVVSENREETQGLFDRPAFPLIVPASRELMRQFLWRRLASSPAALRQTASRQRRFHTRALEAAQRGLRLERDDYRRLFGSDEEAVVFQDLLFPDLWMQQGRIAEEDIRGEIDAWHAIVAFAEGCRDAKLAELSALFDAQSIERPILLFTESVATAEYLARTLRPIAATQMITSRFSRDSLGRRTSVHVALESFRRGDVSALICTDLAAEGLNLQRAATVVHYDLPWNPVKLDQRTGRACRLGSERSGVTAVYFVPDESQRPVMRAITRKNRQRRRLVLSGSGTPVRDETTICEPSDLVSRSLIPAIVSRNSPQARIAERLVRSRSVVTALLDLLASRYSSGVEILLDEIAGELLTPRKLSDLEAVLRLERDAKNRQV